MAIIPSGRNGCRALLEGWAESADNTRPRCPKDANGSVGVRQHQRSNHMDRLRLAAYPRLPIVPIKRLWVKVTMQKTSYRANNFPYLNSSVMFQNYFMIAALPFFPRSVQYCRGPTLPLISSAF